MLVSSVLEWTLHLMVGFSIGMLSEKKKKRKKTKDEISGVNLNLNSKILDSG